MRAKARTYSLVLLKRAARYTDPDAGAVVRERGRRNHLLLADGVLAIVCPVADDSERAGIGIFDAPPGETARIMDGDPAVKAGVLSYEVHPVRRFPAIASRPAQPQTRAPDHPPICAPEGDRPYADPGGAERRQCTRCSRRG